MTPNQTGEQAAEFSKTINRPKPTRNAATEIFVFYKDRDGVNGLTKFVFKSEFDQWLKETNVSIISVIRGVEKTFRQELKVTFE